MNKKTAILYLPLLQAFADGKTIEILANRRGCEDWEETVSLDFSCAPDCYRIKPEPVMVPLGPQDVPPGSVIRHVGSEYWSLVIYANREIVKLHDRGIKYEHLCPTYEIKRPGEDWKPCYKPA